LNPLKERGERERESNRLFFNGQNMDWKNERYKRSYSKFIEKKKWRRNVKKMERKCWKKS